MLIRYIGARERKRDNVTDSAAVWTQAEPVQDVPEDVGQRLVKYSSVWVAEDVEAAPAEPETGEATSTEAEPIATEAEPVATEAEPVATEAEPVATEPTRAGRPRKNTK